MMVRAKYYIRRALPLALLLWFMPAAAGSPLADALSETTKQIEDLWGEGACETVLLRKKGYPLASIACNGSYSAMQREKFLDILLKNFFSVRSEKYRLRPQNGMYLYKTSYGNRPVYFKLFVRNAFDLWPKNPVNGKQIALYIQNVRALSDLVKWRTLGIPLTFGITLGRGDSNEIMKQVSAYGDEVWLAIPLEDDNTEVADGNLLSISEALNGEQLAEYLKDLDGDDGIIGISPLYCSRFCKNVPALRALFSAIREKNEGKEIILLDADPHEDSSFYETGRIMNFRTFRAQVMPGKGNNFCGTVTRFAQSDGQNATRVIAVDAADDQAFKCLKTVSGAAKPSLEFVRVSALSLTNPFR